MKSILNFKNMIVTAVLLFTATACEKEDFLVFTATTNSTLSFENSINPVYKISNATSSNIAERLVWNVPDFEAPTTVTYLVELSTDKNFSSINLDSGDTSNNHYGISVSDLIEIATALGLDEDPSTTNDAGEPNTTGVVYARVKAFAGSSSSGANQVALTSSAISLNIEMLEAAASCEEVSLSTWGLVGSAVNNWGGDNRGFAAGNDVPFLSNGTEGLYRAALYMSDGEFKIRQDNDWAVDYGLAGTSAFKNGNMTDYSIELAGGNFSVTAGNYYVEFNETEKTISVTAADSVWGIVGSATLNGWGDGPDVKMIPDPCNDGIYVVYGVTLSDGEMKFRADDDWAVDYGLAGTSAFKNGNMTDYSIELAGGNFSVTAGTYDITLDTVNLSCSIDRKD